jgi:hypothetical protein
MNFDDFSNDIDELVVNWSVWRLGQLSNDCQSKSLIGKFSEVECANLKGCCSILLESNDDDDVCDLLMLRFFFR